MTGCEIRTATAVPVRMVRMVRNALTSVFADFSGANRTHCTEFRTIRTAAYALVTGFRTRPVR